MTESMSPPATTCNDREQPTAALEAQQEPPHRNDDAFASIAANYRWRPAYPHQLYAALIEHFALDGSQRLLDLGCGTGHFTLPIAPAVDHVLALDCVPEMLAYGSRQAERAGVGHRITWLHAAADHLPALGLGDVDLAVAACSMTWMDPVQVLADLDPIITPTGGVALIDSARPSDYPRPAWQIAADDVRRNWRGTEPSPRTPGTAAAPDHGRVLAGSAFSHTVFREWETPIERTLDAVVGLQYSYAGTAPAVLSADLAAYEHELRQRLRDVCPDGRFADRRRTRAWMATRPLPAAASSRPNLA